MINEFPLLQTERLILRQFRFGDSDIVQELAARKEISEGTFIPYPYEDGMARNWIKNQYEYYLKGVLFNFAIILASENRLIGSMGLTLENYGVTAQLGYWIGVPYWGNGFCTEAGHEVLRFGFEDLRLKSIYASHFSDNKASGRVLRKLGMSYAGKKTGYFRHMGQLKDAEFYYLHIDDYQGKR